MLTLQSPIFGSYEVVQFFELGNLEGTHSRVVYDPHTHSIVWWNGNPIPYPSHSNTKPPHTNTIAMGEAFQAIPKLSLGVWGPLSKM
jgi:hypothetical protein